MELSQFIIPLAILLVAVVYSSVGHGGASGYLAVLAIAGIDPDITRPTALVLNLFVASIASYHFWRTGNFSARLFISFAIASIPFAFLGGVLRMPTHIYKYVLGGVLAFAAARLVWRFSDDREFRLPSLPVALFAGASSDFFPDWSALAAAYF
ncbi:MAG: Sulfite exporter TauE/SafE [Acidobacteria bacterium OLB17]|nr:MAG: Sulfite exporter TauE/SafE [Acidobacteria bacterium OLB17]